MIYSFIPASAWMTIRLDCARIGLMNLQKFVAIPRQEVMQIAKNGHRRDSQSALETHSVPFTFYLTNAQSIGQSAIMLFSE
jgi:hypothetical protein